MQCSEGTFPVLSASVTAGKTTLLNFRRRIESGAPRPQNQQNGAEFRPSGLPQDPSRQLGFEAQGLLLGDLVQLHGPLQVCTHAIHPG